MYEQNQDAKKAYAKAHAVNRSHGGAGMSAEEFTELTEEWDELEYYPSSELESTLRGGFSAKAKGLYIFSMLYRHVETSCKDKPKISEEKWKMNFTVETEEEKVEAYESEEEDEMVIPPKTFDVECRLYAEEG